MLGKVVARVHGWLDNPWVWQGQRVVLNRLFGLYDRRFAVLKEWGVFEEGASVLDIGCGIGQYAAAAKGDYLGIDLSARYVEYARKRYPAGNKQFRCVDVTRLWEERRRFDLALLVDFLHHIPDDAAVKLLRQAGELSFGYVASFEPLRTQSNPVGRFIVSKDRGEYMRPLGELEELFRRAGLPIADNRELYLGPIRTRAILCRAQAVPLSRAG
jgi:SAM-dependent methyltransferase